MKQPLITFDVELAMGGQTASERKYLALPRFDMQLTKLDPAGPSGRIIRIRHSP